MRTSLKLAIITLFCLAVAHAQPPGNTFVRLENISPSVHGDTLFVKDATTIVKFPIIYGNRDTNSYNIANAFVVYSDADGIPSRPRGNGTATWAHATTNGGNYKFSPATAGLWLDTTGFYPKSEFGGIFKLGCFGCDGVGADTVVLSGAANDAAQTAARPKDSGVVFVIKILVKLSDTGKFICIDSLTNYPPAGTWKWPSFNFSPFYSAFPTWSGGKCFLIAVNHGCCYDLTGNYDCDTEDLCDIADISAFVDRYTTLAMPCCAAEANMDGSPDGQSDISDLTALIDHLYISFAPLPACQ